MPREERAGAGDPAGSGSGRGEERWTIVRREQALDASPWLRVWRERVRLPGGREVEPFFTIEGREFVVVLALTPRDEALCLWQYKHGVGRMSLTLPAGFLEPGEPPHEAARRELREETGHEASTWTGLGAFVVDGNRGAGKAHFFLARGARPVGSPASGDLEEARLELVGPEALRRHLAEGRVATLASAAGIALGLNATSPLPPSGS